MDILAQLLKDYIKQMEKIKVKARSIVLINQKNDTIANIKDKGKAKIETARTSTTQASQNLELAVQGQFGQKVTQVLEEQQAVLNLLDS